MSLTPIEVRFKVLSEITRAQHFAWRQAVVENCSGIDPEQVVYRMWEITGHETAHAYLKKLDPTMPLPIQVAQSIAWSSECMGEDAAAVIGDNDNEAFVIHKGCPWFLWHKRLNLLKEDQPGCDIWFETTVADINQALGSKLKIQTLGSLPHGEETCKRRIWIEP